MQNHLVGPACSLCHGGIGLVIDVHGFLLLSDGSVLLCSQGI